MPSSYIFVSLPVRIFDDDPLDSLRAVVGPENGDVLQFPVPSLKIGTLDALVQQADDLAKLNQGCESVIAKVSDSLKAILDGDEAKAAEHKTVNDSMVTDALRPAVAHANLSISRAHGQLPTNLSVEQGPVSSRPADWGADRQHAEGAPEHR